MSLPYAQCQSEEDRLDPYLMVSETSKQKQVGKFGFSKLLMIRSVEDLLQLEAT